jgi:hypothetical protein
MQLALSPGLYRFEAVRDGVVVATDTQLVQAGATLSLHLHEPGEAEEGASSMPPKPALVSTVSRSGPSERRLQNGAVGLDSALSQQQLSDVIKAHQSELQQCYERTVPEAAVTGAPLTLELELSVAASGGVTAAHTRGSNLPALATCVEQVAQTWLFPQAVQTSQLRFPLTFRRSAQLTAAQLTAVVARSKSSLQRCYAGSTSGSEVLRLDVEMEVLPSGTVSSVQIASDHPDVDACITRLMRLWQFPSAESPTRTRFPVLLLPGV